MNLVIAHGDDNHFVINTFGLHNASLLRKALPRHLFDPKPLYADRKSHHSILAATLRTTQDAKRARTQEKRKATLALNRAKKQAVEAQKDSPVDIEEEDQIFLSDDEEEPAEQPTTLSRKRRRT